MLLLSPASGHTTGRAKPSTTVACRIGDLWGRGKYTSELSTVVCPVPMFPSAVGYTYHETGTLRLYQR